MHRVGVVSEIMLIRTMLIHSMKPLVAGNCPRPSKSLMLALAALALLPAHGQQTATAPEADMPAPATPLADRQIQARAQSNRMVYIDGKPADEATQQADADSLRRLVAGYYYDQFRNSQDPDMPYFLFMSKGSGLTLGVGGGVRMRMFYDWNGAVPTNSFSPITIPIPEDVARRESFNATPSGTYLTAQLIGHNTRIGSYGLYIEADFTGYQGRDFRLKKSYAVVRDFTFGYATSTFSDMAAQPPIVDAAGPNNKFSNTNVLVRYMPVFRRRWYVAASVETPQTAVDVSDGSVRTASNLTPDFAAFVQYQWAKGQHVRLSGIVRTLSYVTLATGQRHNLGGWGVQASAVGRLLNSVTLYGTANYGRGYASLGGDLLMGAYDLVPEPGEPGYLYAPAALGWCLGVQYNFRPNLFTTLACSQTRYLPHHGIGADEYKRGVFAAANVFWSIMPRLTVAAEYDWGYRRNFSGRHKAASRANLSAMFTF